MLVSSRQRLSAELPDDARVLDVGGWAKPFARADAVIDLMPYETRGLYGYDEGTRDAERFTEATWVRRDICSREPWPFRDNEFDFVICSHTLEDIRDPVWVCGELQRIARAGYIEIPSRLEEQTYGVQGPWVGWGHHHWLIEVEPDPPAITFVFKHHIIHGRPEMQLARSFWEQLSPEDKVKTLWWQGSFDARERVIVDAAEADAWLAAPVAAHSNAASPPKSRRGVLAGLRARKQ
jgi:hypothetical protein